MNKSSEESGKSTIWSNIKDWCLKILSKTVQSLAAKWLVGFLVGLPILYKTDEFAFGSSIALWMTHPIKGQILSISPRLILLSTGTIVLTFLLGYHIQKYYWRKKIYFFTAVGDYKWKTNIATRETPNELYCRLHELPLNEYKTGYWCPTKGCKIGRHQKDFPNTIVVAYLNACSIADAKLDRHFKQNIFDSLKSWWSFRKRVNGLNKRK
jgi:hypothetical protein